MLAAPYHDIGEILRGRLGELFLGGSAGQQGLGLLGCHLPHLARGDPDVVTRIDPVGILDLAVVLPDRRPDPGRPQVGVGDEPERISAAHHVDAARAALGVVADAAELNPGRLLGDRGSGHGGLRRLRRDGFRHLGSGGFRYGIRVRTDHGKRGLRTR
jgi:hypothetical protein